MGHIAPTDVVPALRHNLAFSHSPPGLGTGFVSVKNVDSGEEYMLRGFEYSLARMLDGHRTAAEVVDAADQVGLPVTLSDLDGFVKKLSDRHLVQPSGEPITDDELSPWQQRREWDPTRREQFRAALREGRAGNLNRALLSLDLLLNDHPDTPEALKLRERLEARRRAPDRVEPFREVFAQTEKGWHTGDALARQPMSPERAARIAAIVCLVIGVAVMAATLIPVPRTITTQTTLVPITSSKVMAPRSGTIGEIPVKIGQWVDQGTVLFSYDVSQTLRQLEGAVSRLDTLNRGLYTELPDTRAAKAARARFVLAETQLRTAELNRDDGTVPLATAQDSLNQALDEHLRAREALDTFVPEEKRTALHEQRTEVQLLETQALDHEVKAPVSGAITALLATQPNTEVFKGQVVVQIDDHRKLKALVTVETRDRNALEPGQQVLLISDGRATSTTLEAVSGRSAEIVIDNAELAFQPGAAEAQIRAKPAPLVR